MDPIYSELFKTIGPSGVFLWMLYKIVLRYEKIVTENTRVQTLVVSALERLSDK